MQRLQAKVIIVAGGGGIGSELARRFAAEGASVVLGDIALEPVQRVVDDIIARGGQALAVEFDGADEVSARAAVEAAVGRFGGLDGMHVNFATFVDGGFDTGILELPLSDLDETIRTNLRGYYVCTRAALPEILKRRAGSIVYTSSPAACKGEPTRVAYAMAKAGVEALMRHVASRYGADGIRANCISPGSTMHERLEGELDEATRQWCLDLAIVKSRLGRPSDIAAMSALLMSDEGGYITGQVIGVDGGVILRR